VVVGILVSLQCEREAAGPMGELAEKGDCGQPPAQIRLVEGGEVEVGAPALTSHLKQGDLIGSCQQDDGFLWGQGMLGCQLDCCMGSLDCLLGGREVSPCYQIHTALHRPDGSMPPRAVTAVRGALQFGGCCDPSTA